MNHQKAYRLAVRLLPAAHRRQFADDQVWLYADLVAHGERPWRLWLGLPRDLVAVHASSRRGRRSLQVAGGPQLTTPWTPRRAARTALAAAVAALHAGWLAAHLAAGLYWQMIQTRAAKDLGDHWSSTRWQTYLDGSAGPQPQLDRMLAGLATADLWLLALFVVAMASVGALPARRWFVLAWTVLWPLGMLLRVGYGDVAT